MYIIPVDKIPVLQKLTCIYWNTCTYLSVYSPLVLRLQTSSCPPAPSWRSTSPCCTTSWRWRPPRAASCSTARTASSWPCASRWRPCNWRTGFRSTSCGCTSTRQSWSSTTKSCSRSTSRYPTHIHVLYIYTYMYMYAHCAYMYIYIYAPTHVLYV